MIGEAGTVRTNSIAATSRKATMKTFLVFVSLVLLLVLAIIFGISFGSTDIAPLNVVKILVSKIGLVDANKLNEAETTVVWLIRVPRVLVAAFVGAGLAISGAQMQGLFKNPLASPDIIGTSAGASFGAVVAIALGLAARSLFYLPIFAFLGALLSLFAVYAIATSRGKTPVATLLLSGVALSALIGAATSFVISLKFVSYQIAQEIIFWLMGGLDNRTWSHVWLIAPFVMLGILIAVFYMRELDLMLLGEEAASSLGVEVEHTKRIVLTSAALMTGAAVAVSGIVGFVGLLVPHIVRLLLGPSHRRLIPASALMGAAFLIITDLIARTLTRPEEIRLGIVTATFGAPFFLYLLMKHKRESLTL